MDLKKKSRVVLAGLPVSRVSDFEHQSSMDELETCYNTGI